jgi:hypothetical protein
MSKQEILNQVRQSFGSVPGFMSEMPEAVLAQYWSTLSWVLADTKLTARDKALVAFGATTAIESLRGSSFVKCDTKTFDQWIPVLFSIELKPRAGRRRPAVFAIAS